MSDRETSGIFFAPPVPLNAVQWGKFFPDLDENTAGVFVLCYSYNKHSHSHLGSQPKKLNYTVQNMKLLLLPTKLEWSVIIQWYVT